MKKTALIGTLLVSGLALAACGSSGDGSSDESSSPQPTVTETATETVTTTASAPTDSPSGSPGATTPSASGSGSKSAPAAARCTIDDVSVSLGPSEGAAGSTFVPIRLTNTSSKPCRTGGFGGVSLVISPRSEPVGAAADRSDQDSVAPLVLRPGQRATATLRITQAGNFSRARCQPVPTKGLRVYPPNETHAAYVAHTATACGSSKVHLLELRPYRLG